MIQRGVSSMSEPTLPTKKCPNCDGGILFTRRVSSAGGGQGPGLLPGLGQFMHYAEFDVVVCGDCGLTQFFAEPNAYKKIGSQSEWQRITGS
jgi:ribosomal protein S27AE